MPKLLLGQPAATIIKSQLAANRVKRANSYVAILFFGDNVGSRTYTRLKKKFGEELGLEVRILGQDGDNGGKEYTTTDVFSLLAELSSDDKCIGIMVQLPLPSHLEADRAAILAAIDPRKDIDGLGGAAFGLATLKGSDFMPATPAAVLTLLEHYDIPVRGQVIAVIGQSLLIGSPLTTALMARGASVFCCNELADQTKVKDITKKADIIISCTGVIHLIDETYVRNDQSQVVIDVGYGELDGKPAGDINPDAIRDLVKAYSPVPGGIGPLTIACLFKNVTLMNDDVGLPAGR